MYWRWAGGRLAGGKVLGPGGKIHGSVGLWLGGWLGSGGGLGVVVWFDRVWADQSIRHHDLGDGHAEASD